MNAIESTLLHVLGDDEERETYGIKRLAIQNQSATEEEALQSVEGDLVVSD
jgi:hypothetical protein